MFEGLVLVGNRDWTVILVSDADRMDLELGFVVLTSSLILLVSCVLSVWLWSSQCRKKSLEQVRSQAEAEKTALISSNAKKKAENERELNDFMAHEVRNPLAAALSACTFVSSFLDDLPATKTDQAYKAAREDVAIIDSSLQFINDLLRNLLDLHRVSNGQMQLQESATSLLDDVLRPVSNMLYTRGPNIDVLIDCPKDLVIAADRLRLTQIVLNLGRNSLKFVTKGFIRFRASVDKKKGVAVYVEDSGPGVPEEKRNKLFNKFQDSLDSLQQGTGIGLAVCRKLIDIMGGDIVLDETYDSGVEGRPGARFAIYTNRVPLDLDGDDEDAEKAKVIVDREGSDDSAGMSLAGGEGGLPEFCSVLFVDDDTLLRRLFTRSLSKLKPSWSIQQASNGETAIEFATSSSGPYDIIFMDQYMSSPTKQLLGTETVRAMRARGVQSLICGLSANDMREAFLDAGAETFMFKPFPCKPGELVVALQQIWACRSLQPSKAGRESTPEFTETTAPELADNPESASNV